jgi:hypothetical protein
MKSIENRFQNIENLWKKDDNVFDSVADSVAQCISGYIWTV